MAPMQIYRSFCKSVSVYYIAAKGGLAAEIDLEAGAGLRKPKPEESGIVVPGTLIDPLSFAIAPLKAESSSGSFRIAESY